MTEILNYQKLFILLLFILAFHARQSFSKDASITSCYKIPYEICNWRNKQYTEDIIRQAEQTFKNTTQDRSTEAASSCIELQCLDPCNFTNEVEQSIQDMQSDFLPDCSTNNQSNIHNICFYANMLRPVNRFYYCENANSTPKPQMDFLCSKENKNKCIWNPSHEDSKQLCSSISKNECTEKTITPTQFCRNEKYVQMTASTFHELAKCFELNEDDTKLAFALFSHESSFILNAHSTDEDQARCYGALRGDTFATINQYIYARKNISNLLCFETFFTACCGPNKNPTECSQVKEQEKKLRKIKEMKEKNETVDEKDIESEINIEVESVIGNCCKNAKTWQRYADIFLDAEKKCSYLPDKVFPQGILEFKHKDKNGNLRKLSTGKVTALSVEDDKFTCALTHDPYTCMFYSMYYVKMNMKAFEAKLPELPYAFKRDNKQSDVPLFPKKVFRRFSIQTAHNTGTGFIQSAILKKFLTDLQTKLSNSNSNNEPYKSYRNKLNKGISLTEKDLFTEFKKFFDNELTGTEINEESDIFAKTVQDNFNKYVNNEDNQLRTNVQAYVKDTDGRPLSDEEEENFINAVKQQCTIPY